MSYATVSIIAQDPDPDLAARVRGCIANEVMANQYMSTSTLRSRLDLSASMWLLAASAGWAPAWESALAVVTHTDIFPAGARTTAGKGCMLTWQIWSSSLAYVNGEVAA